MSVNDPIQTYREFDEKDPAYQVRILALRVDALVKEKEELEASERALEVRIEALERSLGKGAGILIGLASVGTIGGMLLAFGNKIFAPWIRP